MPYGISNPNYVFGDGSAIHVTHPDGKHSWFYRHPDTREYLHWRAGVTRVGQVDADDIKRIANHDDNEYEIVPLEDSPFDYESG